jgi:ATP-dependent exoDNAse (exonuclease V) beta subunit
MSTKIIPTFLAEKNPHPRDQFIEFDEGPHIYTVHGEGGYTSVTTFIHQQFSHFDADKVIDSMERNGKLNDPNNKYYGMTKDQIKQQWEANRDSAAGSGTKMHYDIECYYNNMEVNNDSIEFQYFKRFVADHPELKPYRTEWTVYYEEYKLSGSIDMVFEKPDGNLVIYDWKRCREIKYDDNYGKYAVPKCINHLPDTNYWHYAIQLNTYKTILEHKYDKKITGLFLVCIHPENTTKNYEKIEVPVLDKEIGDLFAYRKSQLE